MPLLHQIKLENILSFGPDTPALQLNALNVLIGPNGSGKSNLVETILFLKCSTFDLSISVRLSGGVRDWVWRGAKESQPSCLTVEISPLTPSQPSIYHQISFEERNQQLYLLDESLIADKLLYDFDNGVSPLIKYANEEMRNIHPALLSREKSVLSQIRDPEQFPELTHVWTQYDRIRVYREWSFGRLNPARFSQKADGRTDYLEPDCSNLGMVLNRIRRDPVQKEQLIERLNDLYPGIKDVDVSIEGGTVQVFLTEGKYAMPATRLSDGTLRYLCLLAILLHPTPPPLICIEEPELGLHPDVMPAIGKLLKDASTRTQLIVTTHSDELIDSLSDSPEDVVVCEKHDGCTTFNRLDAEQLKVWLKDYSLGNLWRSGQIGGNRW